MVKLNAQISFNSMKLLFDTPSQQHGKIHSEFLNRRFAGMITVMTCELNIGLNSGGKERASIRNLGHAGIVHIAAAHQTERPASKNK